MFTPRRSADGDPRSPQNIRRITYVISPLGEPVSSNMERIEAGPVLSEQQIEDLYNACYQLCIAIYGGGDASVVSERHQEFIRAADALSTRSASAEGDPVASWLDSVDAVDVVSQGSPGGSAGSHSGSISYYSMGSGSVYNAGVVNESDVERDSGSQSPSAEPGGFLPEDYENADLIPIPVDDHQRVFMMRLDAYSDEMVMRGVRGFRLHFRREEGNGYVFDRASNAGSNYSVFLPSDSPYSSLESYDDSLHSGEPNDNSLHSRPRTI